MKYGEFRNFMTLQGKLKNYVINKIKMIEVTAFVWRIQFLFLIKNLVFSHIKQILDIEQFTMYPRMCNFKLIQLFFF